MSARDRDIEGISDALGRDENYRRGKAIRCHTKARFFNATRAIAPQKNTRE